MSLLLLAEKLSAACLVGVGCHFDWVSFVEWFGIISGAMTVAAAGLAAWSIRQASQQSKRNTELVVQERHSNLQIEHLVDLLDFANESKFNGEMVARITRSAASRLQLIDAALPFTRVRYSVPAGIPTPEKLDLEPGAAPNSIDVGDYPTTIGATVDERVICEVADAIRELTEATTRQGQALREAGRARRLA